MTSSIRQVLVHLDATQGALARLTAACGLAGVASVEAPPAGQGLALVAAAALSGGYVVLSRRSLTAGARHLDDVAPGVTASD